MSEEVETSLVDQLWAIKLRDSLRESADCYFLKWFEEVKSLGISEINTEEWGKIFKENIDEAYRDLCQDVVSMKSKVLEDIAQLMEEINIQEKHLGLERSVFTYNSALGYYVIRKDLVNKKIEFTKLYEARKKEYEHLVIKQNELCAELESPPAFDGITELLSKVQIEQLQANIESLESLKFERLEQYTTMKTEIRATVEQLGLQPKLDEERKILYGDDSDFVLSETNMRSVTKYYESVKREQVQIREEIDHLWSKLENLWSILEESVVDRAAFKESCTGYSIDTLKTLRQEVGRCDELKKVNIKKFVEKLRIKLEKQWKLCFCNEDVKDKFNCFYSDCFTEDLLQFHEYELEKWNRFYDQNKELIDLIHQHQKLWGKLRKMESSFYLISPGPDRYKNRGGQLLKEEKERNKLAKKIPEIEESIKVLAEEYFEENGKPFAMYEIDVLQYIDHLHKEREEEKLQKRTAKKIRDKSPIAIGAMALSIYPTTSSRLRLTPASASKTRVGTPSSIKTTRMTPQAGSKRKIDAGATAASAKKTKTVVSLNVSGKLNKSRRSSDKRNHPKCKRKLESTETAKENIKEDLTYNTFEQTLAHRSDLRSTNFHEVIPKLVLIPDTPNRDHNRNLSPHPNKTPKNATKLTRTNSQCKLIF